MSIETKVEIWKARLLDLSRRNRLLYLKPVRRTLVQIVEPEADALYRALVTEGRKLQFLPRIEEPVQEVPQIESNEPSPAAESPDELDSTPLDSSQTIQELEPEPPPPPAPPKALHAPLNRAPLTSSLYNLRANARIALEEQGVNVMYLAFGVLHWVDAANEVVVSPLLLVPVQLERTSITQPFTLQVRDEDILLNPTLAHKLNLDYHIILPRLPDEPEDLIPNTLLTSIQLIVNQIPAWTISPDVYLGLFSFEKLVMLKDMEARASEIAAHPILQAIAGDPVQPVAVADLPRADELDDKTQPFETFQVLDADSSQQTAIEYSKRGVSFVIEGPPGTGKSQTISNIIAEALAQNKKVLFVSAKMAALEVVYRRLSECGLGNFCLDAHSHRASRGTIVSALGSALYEGYPEAAPALDRLLRLTQVRGELNQHARLLHTPIAPLERTPFEVYAQLATLEETPALVYEIPALMDMDARRFQEIIEGLDNLTALTPVWENYDAHPWRGVTLQAYSFKARTDIEFHFGELIQRLTALEIAAAKLADGLALVDRASLAHILQLQRIALYALQTPSPLTNWFRGGQTAELRQLSHEAQAQYTEYKRECAEFSAHYTDALLERTDLKELLARFETAQTNSLRIFDTNYRDDLRSVRAMARKGHAVSHAEAIRALKQALCVLELRDWQKEHEAELQTRLGRFYSGLNTSWEDTFAALDWVDGLAALFDGETIPEQFIHLVCNRPSRLEVARPLLDDLDSYIKKWQAEWNFLRGLDPNHITALEALPIHDVEAWLGSKMSHLDELEPWILFARAREHLERFGLGAFLQSAHAARLEGDQLKPAFLKRFYHLWLDAVYEHAPGLSVSGDLENKTVAQFWRDDVEQLHIARERLVTQLAQARPAAQWGDAPSSEVTLLKRELVKRKHHKSIRRLLSEIPNLLLTLKPCLMMSPLSVSQYLASAPIIFDMVIFDEASQVPPEEAVAAIVRAKQVIVAGDHQQLPPTPFFQSLGVDEDDEEEWEQSGVMESLLQEAAVVLPSTRLSWHYRSRHESLLAFSNHHFYDDRLVTFPNAAVHDEKFGVDFVYVPDGVYDRSKTRANVIEAKRVAELVLEHFTQSPARSLGVVAFSQAQRAAIDAELQGLLRAQPGSAFEAWLNSKAGDGFFCKSLENVQGDERDVIFFSVGYGKDASGTMTLNFGPLNGEDGARRLNVAITRAREHVKLISSILPADLDAGRNGSTGVQLLREYMDYCARQHGQQEFAATVSRFQVQDADMVETIQRALAARGLEAHPYIGTGVERIDLAVVDPENPERYILGIELDGAAFRAAKTARERERLRVQVLEGLGWRIYRLRARDWVANPSEQVERIVQAISALETPAHAWSWLPAHANGNGNKQAPIPSGIVEYKIAELPRQGTPEQFYRASPRTFEELFVALAAQEGPVHWHAAVKRLAACWGIVRVTPAVEQHLDAQLAKLIERQVVALRDDFLWSASPTEVIVRQPTEGQEARPIEEIALEEIAKAECLNLQNALSLTEEDLIAQSARLLGYPRAGERVKRRLQAALADLEQSGHVKRSGGKLEMGAVSDRTKSPSSDLPGSENP